jgi:hypothetical protein
MAKHAKHGTPENPLARKQPEEEGERGGGVSGGEFGEQPRGQSYYHQVGLKEGPGHAPGGGTTSPEAPPLADKSDASEHQAEGPGGKGPGAGM